MAVPLLLVMLQMMWSAAAGDVINVHLVAHTHDDVGWLKTTDEYLFGLNNSIQVANVSQIISAVVSALAANQDRKFVYIEQAFFQRWWRLQTETTKHLVRHLVNTGQLSFANGGWCMHDEATTHFVDMIDQTTVGHQYLLQQFNFTPRAGWQLDPFGHSATQASLLSAAAGLESLFFGRVDYQDLTLRKSQKRVEMIWQASRSLPELRVFAGLTGEYGGNYGPPEGLCFEGDNGCDDTVTWYNDPVKFGELVVAAEEMASKTVGNNIMFTMGSDFKYENAEGWFGAMDALIALSKIDGRLNMFYSTPEIYADSKAEEMATGNTSFDRKFDDFFPYADGDHNYWTGFYTSRPALKRFVRAQSAFVQFSHQLAAIGQQAGGSELQLLSEVQAELQHHDAVTGTSKQHVVFDYVARSVAAVAAVQEGQSMALQQLTGAKLQWSRCPLLNISVCKPTQSLTHTNRATQSDISHSATTLVLAWNPSSHRQRRTLQLPVGLSNLFKVKNSSGHVIPSQLLQTPVSVSSGETQLLAFDASLPAQGFGTFEITAQQGARLPLGAAAAEQGVQAILEEATSIMKSDVTIENLFLELVFCADTNLLCRVNNKEDGTTVDVQQDFHWYEGYPQSWNQQASGAYIFRPHSNTPHNVSKPSLRVTRGDVVQLVDQVFESWLTQRVSLGTTDKFFTMSHTIGPIPFEDGLGKEVITRFSSSIRNNSTLWTDSNGREMQERKLNFRPTWPLEQHEPVSGNYYPVTSAVFIRDDENQLTLLPDCSVGAASLAPGALEVMLHRRLLHDDGRGVGEFLNETDRITPYDTSGYGGKHIGKGLVATGNLRVGVHTRATADSLWRAEMDAVYWSPQLSFAAGTLPDLNTGQLSLLGKTLPENLHIVSLQRMTHTHLLLRLGNRFAVGEGSLAVPTDVDLNSLLGPWRVIDVNETSLTANQLKKEMLSKRKWSRSANEPVLDWKLSTVVTLRPMEIRTFLIQVTNSIY